MTFEENVKLLRWLLGADDEEDPVDEFEDALAAERGLVRHPTIASDEWRRVRVQFLDHDDVAQAEDCGQPETKPEDG